VLATFGLLLSAGVTAAGMHYLVHWPWLGALVFGVLIAATDPVSVIAIFKEAKAHGRLLVLIEAESLFNDGTAAVAFGILVALASGQQLTALEISSMLAETIGGGVLCGGVVALGALLLAGRTDDHLVEITVTTVAALALSCWRNILAGRASWRRSRQGSSWAISSRSGRSLTGEKKPSRHFGSTPLSLRTR
jgi:monovalent cation:H+ antiporter, CPA1 family